MEFKRACPRCGKVICYKTLQSKRRANKENRVCHSCRYLLYPPNHNKGKVLPDSVKEKLRKANSGRPSWNRGIPMSEESKNKLRHSIQKMNGRRTHWNLGKKSSPETRRKLSESHRGQIPWMAGKQHTEETRQKIRNSLIHTLAKRGVSSKYNPVACKFIDALNVQRGWSLQHALNGGEVSICGYFIDGYDAKRGIIFEYDEPRHHLSRNVVKDKRRQENILRYFRSHGKAVRFYRFDEKYNNFYEVFL